MKSEIERQTYRQRERKKARIMEKTNRRTDSSKRNFLYKKQLRPIRRPFRRDRQREGKKTRRTDRQTERKTERHKERQTYFFY